jgi:hypothetical protein
MADDSYDLIRGTVIQRSFVGSEAVNIINIATVPITEVVTERQFEDPNFLRFLTAGILGVPEKSLIDESQYANLARYLRNFPPPSTSARPRPLDRISPVSYALFYDLLRNDVSINNDRPIVSFAEDVILFLTSYFAQKTIITSEIVNGIAIELRDQGIERDIELEALS